MSSERKQVKKFLKPKLNTATEEAPTNGKRSGIMLAVGALAVAAIAVWFASSNLAPSSPSSTSEAVKQPTTAKFIHLDETTAKPSAGPQNPAAAAPAKKDSTVPTYDEYVKQAKLNKWMPTDPILKLESSILKYSQVLSTAVV